MNKTTVIYHSADHDGIFCREIARKFLPGAELIGWNFGDKALPVPEGQIYILDLPVDKIFGFNFGPEQKTATPEQVKGIVKLAFQNLIWIDHHKSAIASHATDIPGYRIDGVAACRLAWQWFTRGPFKCMEEIPTDIMFKQRLVQEPLAVRLVGEYDVWDHRGDGDLEFQFGLDAQENIDWCGLLRVGPDGSGWTLKIVQDGRSAMCCYAKRDADIMRERSFLAEWQGLRFLCLNTAHCNSHTFAARDVPETGHDALLGFYYNGSLWTVSLYHAKHRKDLDLSLIAVKFGGGGHRGACGFTSIVIPWLSPITQ